MRIVLDTNILVSALIMNGKPRTVLKSIITKDHKLIFSRKIIEEFVEVTSEPRIRKYVTRDEATRFLQDIAPVSKMIIVKTKLRIARDYKDNPILATAHDGHADYLVTGDDDLLVLKKYRRLRIVTASDMLKILEK
jgi:putative PIN family toxin of toxin-antitoxin system